MNPHRRPPASVPPLEKEIKVRIPPGQHVKLHTIKVLYGQPISTTVREALEAYFRAFEADHPLPEAPALARLAAAQPSTDE